MPYAVNDGVKLYFEEAGTGYPIIFVHEFAGDHRSWEPQLRHFSRRYRCVTYGARGYPPSDVPADVSAYSQEHAISDLCAVMTHLDIDKAHIVGLSMGGFATLHMALDHPARASALVVAGCGYGAPAADRARFKAEILPLADQLEKDGMADAGSGYVTGLYRVQFRDKDPRGYEEFARRFIEHSALGSAHTLRGVQASRPSLFDLEARLREIAVPMLLVTGDEDEPCTDANIFMKRTIPSAGLFVVPRTGHTINLEEPDLFNSACQAFFSSVERGRWSVRGAAAMSPAQIMSAGKTE